MFSKADSSQTNLSDTPNEPALLVPRHRRRLYALAGIIIIAVIASALYVPQAFGTSIGLSLNYTVGEKMVYTTTNTVTNQMRNTSINMETNPLSETYNSTASYEILSFNGENYTIKMTVTSEIMGRTITIPLTTNTSKTKYYNNFLPSGAPPFFLNVSGNPTFEAYLAKSQVNVGDTWQFPVSTGNSSLGLTGELTLKFSGIQDLTVPAGTYKVFIIEISSSKLNMHADADYLNTIHLSIPKNMSLQISGNTYLEQGTCRVIKSDLIQETTFQATGIGSTSVIYTEKILVEHKKP